MGAPVELLEYLGIADLLTQDVGLMDFILQGLVALASL